MGKEVKLQASQIRPEPAPAAGHRAQETIACKTIGTRDVGLAEHDISARKRTDTLATMRPVNIR
jgi:hypothetical protein